MRYLILILIVLLLLPVVALTDDIYAPRFTWEPPTEFVSGHRLDPAVDLVEFRLYCTPQLDGAPIVLEHTDAEWQAPNRLFPPGDYACYMTSLATTGIESDPSNTAEFTVSPDRPRPTVLFVL